MSIVTPVCVFFARHPDEELTAQDIGSKWGVNPQYVGKSLRYAQIKGWLASTKKANPNAPTKKILFYSAGPRLLKEIGK